MIKVLLFTSVNVCNDYCLHIFLNTSTGYVLAAENSTESLFLKELKRRGISSRKSGA